MMRIIMMRIMTHEQLVHLYFDAEGPPSRLRRGRGAPLGQEPPRQAAALARRALARAPRPGGAPRAPGYLADGSSRGGTSVRVGLRCRSASCRASGVDQR